MKLEFATPEALDAFGVSLGAELRAGDLLVLDGPLGAGKTTLTRGIGRGLGVRGPVSSPTFVLARSHPSLVGGPPLVHVDAYRLGSAAELDDLDLDYANSVVVVEWGAGLVDGVADSLLQISIARPVGAAAAAADPSGLDPAGIGAGGTGVADPDEAPVEPRILTITAIGPRWAGTRWAG